MKYLILALLLTGCTNQEEKEKKERACVQAQLDQVECLLKISEDANNDRGKVLAEVCTFLKQTYPCKITDNDVDLYVDDKCPNPAICK